MSMRKRKQNYHNTYNHKGYAVWANMWQKRKPVNISILKKKRVKYVYY